MRSGSVARFDITDVESVRGLSMLESALPNSVFLCPRSYQCLLVCGRL